MLHNKGIGIYMGQALLNDMLLDWASLNDMLRGWAARMVTNPFLEVTCSSKLIWVRRYSLSPKWVKVPIRIYSLSPKEHIKELEEAVWQGDLRDMLILESTYTWEDLIEIPTEVLINIVNDSGLRGYLATKVLERRLSVC